MGSFEAAAYGMAEEIRERVVADAKDCIACLDVGSLFRMVDKVALLPVADRVEIRSAAKAAFKADFNLKEWDSEIKKHLPKVDKFQLPDDSKRRIQVGGRELCNYINDCIAALEETNDPPALFWRQGQIVHIRSHESGRLEIRQCEEDFLLLRLARVAHFVRELENGEVSCEPTRIAAKSILALDSTSIKLPALRGVSEIPMFRADGTIHSSPGYDEGSQMFYQPSIDFPEVPDDVTADDADVAVEMVRDVLADFPFDSEASAANAIAMLLLPVIRPLITGPTPLACVVAPQAGTGKSMLASICAILATGASYLLPWKREDRENEVTISAAMLGQQPVIVLDNVLGILGSGVLCSALTSSSFQGRVLGSSNMFNVPVACTWIATANNLRLGDDMSRRVYKIRMDAKSSKPMQRENFRHPRLLDYVIANRADLVHALLVIARYWFCGGQPRAKVTPLGSFESWHVTMASILKHAGVNGFMDNLEEVLGRDEKDEQWLTFMEGLDETFTGHDFRVADVVSRCSDAQYNLRDLLPPFVNNDNPARLRQSLGQAFHNRQGTRYGEEDLFLEKAGRVRGNVTAWRIVHGKEGGANG